MTERPYWKLMRPTGPRVESSPNMMTMLSSDRLPTFQASTRLKNVTTRFTTKSYSQSSSHWRNGDRNCKAPRKHSRLSRIIRISSISPQPKHSTRDKFDGPNSYPSSTSASCTGRGPKPRALTPLAENRKTALLKLTLTTTGSKTANDVSSHGTFSTQLRSLTSCARQTRTV